MYKLIDSGNMRKLEQVGDYRFIRPAQAAVWKPSLPEKEWQKADATFERKAGGDGKWHLRNKKIPPTWPVEIDGLTVLSKLTDFGHIGMFPEHHAYKALAQTIQDFAQHNRRPFRLLNLFAYTGIPSLLALKEGAEVVHVDASKTSVAWARDNAAQAKLADKPIRWIVDDAQKFLLREVKRGVTYDGILLDPPSYGRGANNQVWKIESHLNEMLDVLPKLLTPEFAFIQLSAHTPGYTPITLENLLGDTLGDLAKNIAITSGEMTIQEARPNGRRLPSGACALARRLYKKGT